MSHIQLYANLYDVWPTEHWKLQLPDNPDDLVDPAEKVLYATNGDCIKAFQKDIQKNGVKFQVKLHPSGLIGDGNCRYWGLRRSWEKTFNARFFSVPIDLPYFLGLEVNKGDMNIRGNIINSLIPMYNKKPVIKGRETYPDIDLKSLHRGNNPYGRITNQIHFRRQY